MSLQVWLPLTNGTLKQQGLKNAAATIGGTVGLTDAGKLGKCATIGAAAGGITLPASTMTSFTECSVAFWINITAWNTSWDTIFQAGLGSTAWNNYIFGILRNQSDYLSFTISNGSSTSSGSYVSSNLTIGQWIHLTFTYGNGKCKIYINGVLDKEYSTSITPNFASITHIAIGRSTNGTSYQSKCKLNDFRIYDHCLSPMEVKELAKGLVLHYPLNRQGWGQENLVWNSNWNIHSTTPPESWVNWGSPPTREIVTTDGKNWLHVISNTSQFQGYSQNWTKRNGIGELTANTKVTVSFTAKLAAAASIAPIGIHWCNSSGTIISQNWTTTALTTNPKRYSFTYTTPADCVAFNIMVGDNTNIAHEVWVTDIKLELGSIATPWCPNSSDVLATTMGLNSTTEYDCSGFGNNGIKNNITYTSDTPKYTVSSIFNGSDSYIKVNDNNWMVKGMSEMTVNLWAKASTWPATGRLISCTESGGFNLEAGNSGYWRFPIYVYTNSDQTSSAYKYDSKEIRIADLTSNEWNMITLVYNGEGTKTYINGELHHTYTNTSYGINFNTNARLFLGCEANTASPSSPYFNGNECDFRIYTTALSADDVKSLYQNSAYIDSSGNVYGAVHEEV